MNKEPGMDVEDGGVDMPDGTDGITRYPQDSTGAFISPDDLEGKNDGVNNKGDENGPETKDIIDTLSDGDNLGAEKAFKDTINTKVGDALETKRKVANSFVKTQVNQEEDTGDGDNLETVTSHFLKRMNIKSLENIRNSVLK